jgi:hypothetical protein
VGEEKNTRSIEPVRSKTQKVSGWPFFSVFSLQKKPRHAWWLSRSFDEG